MILIQNIVQTKTSINCSVSPNIKVNKMQTKQIKFLWSSCFDIPDLGAPHHTTPLQGGLLVAYMHQLCCIIHTEKEKNLKNSNPIPHRGGGLQITIIEIEDVSKIPFLPMDWTYVPKLS